MLKLLTFKKSSPYCNQRNRKKTLMYFLVRNIIKNMSLPPQRGDIFQTVSKNKDLRKLLYKYKTKHIAKASVVFYDSHRDTNLDMVLFI